MAFQNTSEADRNGRPKYGDEKLKFKFVWPIKANTYKKKFTSNGESKSKSSCRSIIVRTNKRHFQNMSAKCKSCLINREILST